MIKRIVTVIALLSLAASTLAFAQDPSRVLREARDRLQRSRDAAARNADDVPWTPILISFTPMISLPFGYYDSNLALGVIGTLSRDVNGLMASSVFNIARDVRGLEAAGVFNTVNRVFGGQAAGVYSTADQVRGGQASGIFNIAGLMDGFQAAGVFNIADDMRGIQVAGVVNVAHAAQGLQIGLVNIANEMDGVQLGLVNIARDGVGGLGLSFDPSTSHATAWWQNGTRFLYTVFTAEMPLEDCFTTADHLIMGAGLGTRFGGRENLPYLDLEILAAEDLGSRLASIGRVFTDCDASIWPVMAPYPEVRLRLGIPLARHVALVGGVIIDFDLAAFPNLPANLKTEYSSAQSWFGADFTAYGRWFVGVKF